MVNFYLRWWAGHHCILTGFDNILERPKLLQGLTPQANADAPNQLALMELRQPFCPPDGPCLTLGQVSRFAPTPLGNTAVRHAALRPPASASRFLDIVAV